MTDTNSHSPMPSLQLSLHDKASDYYTLNPVTIQKKIHKFESLFRTEYCSDLKRRVAYSCTQDEDEYNNDPQHKADDGSTFPRPTPASRVKMPGTGPAQAIWKLGEFRRMKMITLSSRLTQTLEEAMGTALTIEYENSEFFSSSSASTYVHMRAFLTYKFGVQLKHQALDTAHAGVCAKLAPGGDIFSHNNQHRQSVHTKTALTGEPQSRLDAYTTYVSTLSANPAALGACQLYTTGVYQENGKNFVDLSARTVASLMKCLEVHLRTMPTSTPFAASTTTVNPYPLDPTAAYAAGLAAAAAALNPSTMDAATAYAAGLAAGTAQGKAHRPQRNARNPPATILTAPTALAAPRAIPPTVPYKTGTLYCYWCGYSVPGRSYHWRAHPPPHTGATCPCATNPTAAQRAALNHNAVAGGKYSSETFARA